MEPITVWPLAPQIHIRPTCSAHSPQPKFPTVSAHYSIGTVSKTSSKYHRFKNPGLTIYII